MIKLNLYSSLKICILFFFLIIIIFSKLLKMMVRSSEFSKTLKMKIVLVYFGITNNYNEFLKNKC